MPISPSAGQLILGLDLVLDLVFHPPHRKYVGLLEQELVSLLGLFWKCSQLYSSRCCMVKTKNQGFPCDLLEICWVDLVFGRCTLLLLLAECCHCTWMLEQPSGSNDVLPLHPRINWLFNEVLYVTLLCNYFESYWLNVFRKACGEQKGLLKRSVFFLLFLSKRGSKRHFTF